MKKMTTQNKHYSKQKKQTLSRSDRIKNSQNIAPSVLFKVFFLVLLLVVLIVASGLAIYYQAIHKPEALTAYIYQDGELLDTINLSDVTVPYSFTVTATDGGYNTILVRPGSIGVSDADCPDKVCVSTGYTDSSLLPIVCLPHKLVIEMRETKESNEVDGVTY